MNDSPADPYTRLRPAAPIPEDEICHCLTVTGVILLARLSKNPIVCQICRGEVPPERLGFGAMLAEEIANWLSVYHSLYCLWLDSGEYESWSSARLSDPYGQVNRMGRDIVTRLNEIVPTDYWWFVVSVQPRSCPICAGPLDATGRKDTQACYGCRILLGCQ